jgi:hypothetical protein
MGTVHLTGMEPWEPGAVPDFDPDVHFFSSLPQHFIATLVRFYHILLFLLGCSNPTISKTHANIIGLAAAFSR